MKFVKICAMCDKGFPDSTIVAIRFSEQSKGDTIPDFSIELMNYYSNWCFYDEKNHALIFIGVINFGDGPDNSLFNQFHFMIFDVKTSSISLLTQNFCTANDFVDFRISFDYENGGLTIKRGPKSCIGYPLSDMIAPGFKLKIPTPEFCP